MQALQDKITELLGQTIASGELDNMIREKLSKTIDSILDDLLRVWSPLGKSLKEQLEAGLKVNLDVGLGGYNQLVSEIVSQRLDTAIHGQWKADLQASLDDMLRAAPATIKLSELLKQVAEEAKYEAKENDWEHATLYVEKRDWGSTWVYLDPQPRDSTDKHRFKWSLLITETGDLSAVRTDDASWKSRELFSRKFGFDKLLFQLHACKSKVEMDLGEGIHELEYEHECGADL